VRRHPLVGPFRVFGFAARPLMLPSKGRPLGIGGSFRVLDPLKYCPHGLGNPTLPLAFSSAMWFSLQRGSSGRYSASRSKPLFEFDLPLEYYPAKPSRSANADRLLSWALFPYSTLRIAGPLNAGSPTRYVPPSGFGYPLDGFLPSIPGRFSFTPAALMGFTLRSFLLPEGIRIITTRTHPRTV
jgi:hypothetical protein